jgi:hypothetical protein
VKRKAVERKSLEPAHTINISSLNSLNKQSNEQEKVLFCHFSVTALLLFCHCSITFVRSF